MGVFLLFFFPLATSSSRCKFSSNFSYSSFHMRLKCLSFRCPKKNTSKPVSTNPDVPLEPLYNSWITKKIWLKLFSLVDMRVSCQWGNHPFKAVCCLWWAKDNFPPVVDNKDVFCSVPKFTHEVCWSSVSARKTSQQTTWPAAFQFIGQMSRIP